MAQSTRKKRISKSQKPSKPYPEFPLFAHATRRWAKKIRCKLHYFGRWDDPDAALEKYLEQKDDLHAGRTPRVTGEGLIVRDLCNQFLTAKRHLLDTREITQRTFAIYHSTCKKVIDSFGRNRLVNDLAANDFESFRSFLANGRGPAALGNEIRQSRMLFKYAFDVGLIERPVRFGPSFKMPSKRVLRQARQANGKRMLEADQLRNVINVAGWQLKAMTLLGINCGFGQSDVANLPRSAIDLETGWIEFPRPKTGIERRCPLWPETVEAARKSMAERPTPKNEDDSKLCFLTKYGNRWVRSNEKGTQIDGVAQEFAKLLTSLDLKRRGLNFYCLRHTFETIGGESRDQVAVNFIMGHVDSSMAGVYRERISNERLIVVTDVVHGWLWPSLDDENDRTH